MSKTVVGLFSTIAQAEKVKETLIDDGFDSSDIKVVANSEDGEGIGIGEKISHFFKSLTGGDNDVHEHYASGVNAGGGLLTVTVEDDEATEVVALLKEHGARDIDGGYASAASSGTPVYGGGSSATSTGTVVGETAIPVVEEQLVVGKREVDRGGVRVYSHVVETPVSADVNLRNEQINIERRPVSRVATAADFAAGTGGVVEVLATGEEAVVGKSSRVVEEVLVGKSATERTEAIHDTVRKTEVEVEKIDAEPVKSQTY